jgi:hypothetical protein
LAAGGRLSVMIVVWLAAAGRDAQAVRREELERARLERGRATDAFRDLTWQRASSHRATFDRIRRGARNGAPPFSRVRRSGYGPMTEMGCL